jgi:hypothetical protein
MKNDLDEKLRRYESTMAEFEKERGNLAASGSS